MKTLILLAAIMAVSAPAYAQQINYTCTDVKRHSCSVLKFHAWWNNVSKPDQRRIALKCGMSHCLR